MQAIVMEKNTRYVAWGELWWQFRFSGHCVKHDSLNSELRALLIHRQPRVQVQGLESAGSG